MTTVSKAAKHCIGFLPEKFLAPSLSEAKSFSLLYQGNYLQHHMNS